MCFQGMVCVVEDSHALCIVKDLSVQTDGAGALNTDIELKVPSTTTVRNFLHQVAERLNYQPQNIELVFNPPSGSHVVLTEQDETLQDIGVRLEDRRNLFVIQTVRAINKSPKTKDINVPEEELNLGASASPTTFYYASHSPAHATPAATSSASQSTNQEYSYNAGLIKQDTGYVGLVNQAMTCYLNSLLQALFMTPEFRNALYKWKYDSSKGRNPEKCIPYQLQRLFLNLQTSNRTAVETTELTRSFGWDSSEAWQQHDIQELCRVMFDALETVFKDTNQADLIDRLYQGKMIDYVKCLECSQEKSREDTFLDIPLPVRPFGSTVAYGSVEEALKAFVQPETLDGANQYYCESCAKKCNAHKGLKFTKFPYLLTLHLKRFDFDYSTMHRIKLNDKVTFPELLDLNGFVEGAGLGADKEEGSEGVPEELAGSKCDDSSTTDSGSALDDESCQGPTDSAASQDTLLNNQDDDEGIDVSGGNGSNHQENEKNRRQGLSNGPYHYELFSIMIHSGSASGGHYYAYIKDFSNGEWFCFNDSSVTRITTDDIAKTYGGGSARGYYSGAYSSSTNAYMLMYRQINNSNCYTMRVEQFPEHIKELYQDLQEKQESDRKFRERTSDMMKMTVYCQHPSKGMTDAKLYVHNDSTLEDVTAQAYDALKLNGLVDPSDCRIVSYNTNQESIDVSFQGKESENFGELIFNLKTKDLLLEIKNKEEEFIDYKPGGLTVKAYVVDLGNEEVEVPHISVRSALSSTVAELKASIGMHFKVNLNPDKILLLIEKYPNHIPLEDDEATLQEAGFYSSKKVYVCSLEQPFTKHQLHAIIDRFEHVITLHLTLPDTDPDTLARLTIPSLSAVKAAATKQGGDSLAPPLERVSAQHQSSSESVAGGKTSGSRGLVLPLILTGGGGGDEESSGACGGTTSDQSTSEDSSLTDSDRTIIGDVQDECECLSEGYNTLASPPEEMEPNPLPTTSEENWDEEPQSSDKLHMFFKATPYETDSKKMIRVQVDKRMSVEALKTCLEPLVGVPASCFKLFRTTGSGESETSSRSRHCESLGCLNSEDTLNIRLGRQLTNDEHKIKIYQLFINAPQQFKYLCEWIVVKGGTAGQTKKELIEDLNKRFNLNLQYNMCRLRKKNWKSIGRVFLDNMKWVEDITVYSNGDVFLQELSGPDPVTLPSQLCVLVRHWHPSTLTLDPFQELVLDTFSIEELKDKLSKLSSIPVENVDFAKPNGLFPCEMSVLNINTDLDWKPNATSLESWPIQFSEDGGILFYRDNKEEVKSLTQEERNELSAKELARLNSSTSSASSYSPRKERPLKIYLDLRPATKMLTEADVD